jgi:hypothetical protein
VSVWEWFKSLFASIPAAPAPIVPPPTPPPPTVASGLQAALSWELPCHDTQILQGPHPERHPWSVALYWEIQKNYQTFIRATDIRTVIPTMDNLDETQRITKLCELMVGVAKYECSWNPAATSSDVTGATEVDQLATGLFQLNVADQKWYHTGTNFTHEQLKDPINNIKAGVGIVVHLIEKYGSITFQKGHHGSPAPFFETLMFGAKYENVQNILKMVNDLKV